MTWSNSAEEEARDLLARMGINGMRFHTGELDELINYIHTARQVEPESPKDTVLQQITITLKLKNGLRHRGFPGELL